MLTTILTGILIGLCVSVPVGPLGVLCIQRTVTRGRWHGVVTGLGATTSDLVYALLVGCSMGFIIEFIEAHQLWIQVIGSLIIGVFGFHIYTKDPLKQLEHKRRKHSRGDLFSDYIRNLKNITDVIDNYKKLQETMKLYNFYQDSQQNEDGEEFFDREE